MNAITQILDDYLTSKDQLRTRTIFRDADSNSRIISTTGDTPIEGVSVIFAAVRRTQLIIEDTGNGTGAYTRAEGSVEAITLTTPSSGTNAWSNSTVVPVPGTTPLAYIQMTPEELVLVTGADVFLPALQNAMILRAQQALTPAPPPEILP